jgi:D-amino-acid dehydrogenase
VRLENGDVVEATNVVLAAGVWTTALAADAGVSVPMEAGKGYHLDLPAPDPCPRTPSVLAETFVAVNPFGDRLRLAGTLEFTGINADMLERRLEMLPEAAAGYLRSVTAGDRANGVAWCGLRPCTADGLPAVGWTDVDGLFVATGHAMMGFALGPLTGRLVAESILDGRPSLPLDPVSPRRFR